MTAAQTFKAKLALGPDSGEFCREGYEWAIKQKDLATAWRTCKNGAWMAYWLVYSTQTNVRDVLRVGGRLAPGDEMNVNHRLSARELSRYATAMRAHFNSDGTHRKHSRGKQ